MNLFDQNDEELKKQILLRSLIGGDETSYNKPMIGNEQTAHVARGLSNAADLFVGRKPQFPVGGNSKLAEAMALAQFKQNVKPFEEEEGYASEADMPETLGGLPIKTVTPGRGGRLKPVYGKPTPLFGGGVDDILEQFNSPQVGEPATPTSYPVQPNQDFDALLAEADYANMSDEEQEDFIKFLESKIGGQDANRQ